jgi:hypothetical protein
MAENKYKFITKKWMFNVNEFYMDCHPKRAAKCCTRPHHKHDPSDMIIGATFETNEQNIFCNLFHWIALPSITHNTKQGWMHLSKI